MGRPKVRNYFSMNDYEDEIEDYFNENKTAVIDYVLRELGYKDLETLREDEYNMKFGLDCGWVTLTPNDKDMLHEWELDNGKYMTDIYIHGPFGTQSVTIKEKFAEKLLKDKDWEDKFSIKIRLD